MELNEYVLKLIGSASIDQPLELGRRYACGIEFGITDEKKRDNENNTFDLEYKAKLIRAQIKADNGVMIKTKDKTAQSVKTRLAILNRKDFYKPEMDEDSFYNLVQGYIRHNIDNIINEAIKQ